MEKLKTTNVRDGIKRPYQSPTTSVLALNYLEGVLVVLSWNDGHSKDNFDTKEEDPTGDGKEAKLLNIQFQDMWADDTEDEEENQIWR
jgi:hypothetical protein